MYVAVVGTAARRATVPLLTAEATAGAAVTPQTAPGIGALLVGDGQGNTVGPLDVGQTTTPGQSLLFAPSSDAAAPSAEGWRSLGWLTGAGSASDRPVQPVCTHVVLRVRADAAGSGGDGGGVAEVAEVDSAAAALTEVRVEVMVAGGDEDALKLWELCRHQRHRASVVSAKVSALAVSSGGGGPEPVLSLLVVLAPLAGAQPTEHWWPALAATLRHSPPAPEEAWELVVAYAFNRPGCVPFGFSLWGRDGGPLWFGGTPAVAWGCACS